MKLSFWSNEDRWFVPRSFGLGYSLNLKYVAKRVGWIKAERLQEPPASGPSEHDDAKTNTMTREQRLRQRIESSKHEGVR